MHYKQSHVYGRLQALGSLYMVAPPTAEKFTRPGHGRINIILVASDNETNDNSKLFIEKPTPNTWRLGVKSIQVSIF